MRNRRAWVFVCASIAIGAAKTAAHAQELPLPMPAWGTGGLNVRTIAGTGFHPIRSDSTFVTAFPSIALGLHFRC